MTHEDRLTTNEQIAFDDEYIGKVRDLSNGATKQYHIVTLGCQMNVRDSETVAGMLELMGFRKAQRREDADLILYNTCCVRENAENRALGNVIWLKELKKSKPELLICVAGCMMQEKGMAERLKEAYPFIDLMLGTHNLYRFPMLLYRAMTENDPVTEVLDESRQIVEGMPVRRSHDYMAFINIMYGCNNFCSYCIVPYVRGRERSRAPEDILREARSLKDQGVQEIMLLGQNVNSYRGGSMVFPDLLYALDKLGIPRIRFMTSHPKDLSDELISAMGSLPSLAKHIHLPVQAGSDAVLKRMNRKYTREQYMELVWRLRRAVPDIGLTTDIIVGFPGETQADFEETLSLAEAVRFDAAYTFIYSPRIGTPAARMEDRTRPEEKTERIERLIAVQQAITSQVLASQIGSAQKVLVESVSARNPDDVCGKTSRGHMVNFAGGHELIGTFQEVRIDSIGRNTLRGTLIRR